MRYRQAVASKTRSKCSEPTAALQMRSPERLGVDLYRYVVAAEPEVETDWRDVLVGLAPFYACARRLGVDPVELFDTASNDLHERARELVRTFARRSDITLHSFGWMLENTSDGPCYRPTRDF
jgi:hypothetical protein